VPNDFAREWIEGHFLGLIKAAVKDSIGHERRVSLRVVEGRSASGLPSRFPRRSSARRSAARPG
jgi:chromosomal replication initiation ATPase DnaA